MLRAEELRIGNWVINYKDTPTQILEWSGNEAYLTQGRKAYGIKTSRPIELTEEWLVKFGFESNNSSSNFLTYYNERYDYRIEIYQDGDVWFDELRKIQHVHQLQNLYFALTGEELTLKQ
jgi:predicted GNAT superfamily acetyltransferase